MKPADGFQNCIRTFGSSGSQMLRASKCESRSTTFFQRKTDKAPGSEQNSAMWIRQAILFFVDYLNSTDTT